MNYAFCAPKKTIKFFQRKTQKNNKIIKAQNTYSWECSVIVLDNVANTGFFRFG